MPPSSSPAERAAEQRASQNRSPQNRSPEEVLRRAAAYGVDLSQLRERLRLSPTERVELHAGGAKFVEDLRRASMRRSKS